MELSKVSNFLNSEREGSETFEYVLVVAFLVTLIVFLFTLIGPSFKAKMEEIATEMKNSDDWTTGL